MTAPDAVPAVPPVPAVAVPAAPRRRRPKRTTEQLREALLAAARDAFSENGYGGTTTREVAARAGAAEHLIFKHFGSKAGLFSAAVFEPMDAALDEMIERMEARVDDPSTRLERITDFARTTLETLRRHRQLFLAFLSAQSFHAREFEGLPEAMPSLIARLRVLEDLGRRGASGGGVLVHDWPMELRAVFGMVFAMAVLDELLLDESERDEEREIAALVKLISFGVGVDAEPSSGGRDTAARRRGRLRGGLRSVR